MEVERLNRTWDVFACGCRHGFTIHNGGDYPEYMGNFCTSCGVVWTRVAHIPRYKPIITIQK